MNQENNNNFRPRGQNFGRPFRGRGGGNFQNNNQQFPNHTDNPGFRGRGRGGGGGYNRRGGRDDTLGNLNMGNNQQGSNGNHQQRNNNGNGAGNNRPFSDEVANYGIGYQKIEELCNAMDSKKILPGSSDLLTAVQAESFIKRLDVLWAHLDKKVNFLRVIVATASTNQADLMTLTHKFVGDVLKSKLINTLVDEYICPMPYDPNMQKPLNIQLADYLVKLLLLGFALNPSNMDIHLPKVENVISCLLKIKHILAEDTVQQIERLDISLKDRHETRAAQRLQKSQPKKREYKDFEGSAGEPPMNFRDLSVVPVPEDVGYNYRPYLRAAKKKGKYDSDEHYLDVQFRLLREDLIRPLREGIAAYQKGGTKQTDLYVYTDVELGASTMHQQTGELISYASLKGNRRIRFDKRLKYGSLVCLSSDDFQTVFLFATVIDRDEKALIKNEIGLKFEEH